MSKSKSQFQNPKNISKQWSPAQDKSLLTLSVTFQKDWSIISKLLNNRNSQECQQRYKFIQKKQSKNHQQVSKIQKNNQNFSIKKVIRQKKVSRGDHILKWTKQQDELLVALYNKYPAKWKQISLSLGSRNRRQCQYRYGIISKKNQNNEQIRYDDENNQDYYQKESGNSIQLMSSSYQQQRCNRKNSRESNLNYLQILGILVQNMRNQLLFLNQIAK